MPGGEGALAIDQHMTISHIVSQLVDGGSRTLKRFKALDVSFVDSSDDAHLRQRQCTEPSYVAGVILAKFKNNHFVVAIQLAGKSLDTGGGVEITRCGCYSPAGPDDGRQYLLHGGLSETPRYANPNGWVG